MRPYSQFMKIAFLGTGILGYPMAEKLLEHGHELHVYNRTIQKAEGLKEAGAFLHGKAPEAIQASELIILVLSDANAIEQVLFEKEKILAGKTVIQMGTIASSQSRYFLKRVEKLNGEYFECPVLGSRSEAQEAKLILMAGSSAEQFDRYRDVLSCFGPAPRHVGEVGQAARLKLALNQLIAAHASCFSLSLGLIERSGIDTGLFMEILQESALFAPMYSKKLKNWLAHDYDDPNFPLKHLVKDVVLIAQEAREAKLNTSILEAILAVLKKAEKEGLAEKDYSSVYEAINKE